ncbi:diguanylate cyclase [Rheinheimera aquimaris]|jgi:two-component system cell cycle response regulator|uniref:GGDEF domain-containing response regulator n=2 Tax=Rheinheimera aquimaris TaxID=412437 RepID=UPI000E8B7705|nr:diguanylate cyclase [Rheinheimera aquimaris]HBN88502.1 diguanylate cyclase response regulator [Rheinheimera sp.]
MDALIVEPSPTYQRILSRMLESYDFKLTFVDSAIAGLRQLKLQRFQIICVAMYLPDLTGIEFCRLVRQQNAKVPIFIVTSETEPTLLSSALTAGATDIIRKDDLPRLEESLHALIPLGPFRYNISGKALYLEDSLTVAKATDAKLKRLGLQMDHAFSIAQAMQLLSSNKYELIMTDIVLQDNETGIDFIRDLRADSRFAQTPILAVTSLESINRRIQALQSGANDYISKPVLDEELFARINNLISSTRLIEQLTRERQRLLELATKDHLTGLYNRHFLTELAKRRFADANRQQTALSVLVIDIDHFKQINDQHGHQVGDKVLKRIAVMLQTLFAAEDRYVARFGGEEFVVLLTGYDLQSATEQACQLCQSLHQLQPEGIVTSASIGVATLATGQEEYFDEVFARADKALYLAKQQGRNRAIAL